MGKAELACAREPTSREPRPMVPGAGGEVVGDAAGNLFIRKRIARGADRPEGHPRHPDRPGLVLRRKRPPVPGQHEVGALPPHLPGRCHGEPDLHLRMGPVERGQVGHQPAHGEGGAAGHVQAGFARARPALLQPVQGVRHRRRQDLAARIERQTGPRLVEQRRPQMVLQAADLPAHRAMGAPQLRRRPGHRPQPRHRLEGLERRQGRQGAGHDRP